MTSDLPQWFFKPPATSPLNDHAVNSYGAYLKDKHIAFIITGSVASMKAPLIIRALRRYGAKITVYASKEGLRYATPDVLSWASDNQVVTKLTSKSEHLSGGEPFDAYIVAPATYNTINKVANGIADSAITTTLASALGFLHQKRTSIIFAPAMHGSLHNPLLTKSMVTLHKLGVKFVKPRQEFGKNNLPPKDVIVAEVCRATATSSLKDVPVLVTAGPTPVKIDAIRRITNRFSGKLGILIAQDLYLQGADVMLLQAYSGIRPPIWLPHTLFEYYDDYKDKVLELTSSPYAGTPGPKYGIFSAAVADFRPTDVVDFKISSEDYDVINLDLESTEKVIDLVREANKEIKIISFKYEEDKNLQELSKIAQKRLTEKSHFAIVANSGKLKGPNNEQQAFIFASYDKTSYKKFVGKRQIASGISQLLKEN